MKNPFNLSNFRIEPLNRDTFVVRSDSERFGKDAITFESFSRNDCVEYVFNNSDPAKPSYYVIEDLSTWSTNAALKSKLERYDTFVDAIKAFLGYRSNSYDYSDEKSKLTLGVSVSNAEVDIIHVRNDNNYLVADFIGSPAINTNKHFLNNMMNLNNLIGIDRIRLYDGDVFSDMEYKDWPNSFYHDASIDDFIRNCNCCKNDMFEGYLLEVSGDTYCSEECLHLEVSPDEYEELFESGDACWTTFPIPDGYMLDDVQDYKILVDDEQEMEV